MKKLSSGEKLLLTFTVLYMVAFGISYARALNFEFLAYYAILVAAFVVIFKTLNTTRFPLYILWGLSLWGFLHMAGGSIRVGDGVFYTYKIFPLMVGAGDFYILKMDQVIHAFGFGVTALVVHHLISTKIAKAGASAWGIAVTAICVAMGLGAVNEVIEFIVFVTLPQNGVGDIFNMGLDLIFNMLGAILAIVLLYGFRGNKASQ